MRAAPRGQPGVFTRRSWRRHLKTNGNPRRADRHTELIEQELKIMQKTPKRNKQSFTSSGEPTILPPDKKKRESPDDFVALLPPEVSFQIFSELDIHSLCNAAMTCKSWNHAIDNNDYLWKNHCLTVRAVCQREIDCDRGNGYSWKNHLWPAQHIVFSRQGTKATHPSRVTQLACTTSAPGSVHPIRKSE